MADGMVSRAVVRRGYACGCMLQAIVTVGSSHIPQHPCVCVCVGVCVRARVCVCVCFV